MSSTAHSEEYGLYALIVGVSILLAGAAQIRLDGVFACPASYADDSYLAYCQARGFGDYDRGGFWLDLEPATAKAAGNARVLFLGSSRMQFAFSSDATRDWFGSEGISYYLLGFSHTENVQFVAPLLDKLDPRAEAYVINVDRFFDDRRTEPTEALFDDAEAPGRYAAKRRWQPLHASLCRHLGILCGSHAAFYRHRSDGQWHLAGMEAEFVPAPVSDGPPDPRARLDRYAEIAERFVSELPVARECVLLTLVPYAGTKRDEARFVADRLNAELIEPRAGILRTFDGSHLDPESATLWSQAFFELAGHRLRRCVDVGSQGAAPT
jgi:hypothetical protein